MGDEVKMISYNMKPINIGAGDLINEAKDLLYHSSPFLQSRIDPEDKSPKRIENENRKDAKIIFHKDGKGATVLSGAGAVINIGKELNENDYNKMTTQEKEVYSQTKQEFAYALSEAAEILKAGVTITEEKKQKLESLDKALKDVIIMVTEDNKGIIIADSNGDHFELGSAKVGNYMEPHRGNER